MKYRNMDQALRMMVLEGAVGVEPADVHPTWTSSKDQSIYRTLADRLDDALRRRGASPVISGEDLIQTAITQGKLRMVGSKIQPSVFRRSASALTTANTPLWMWLQRAAIDEGRRQQRRPSELPAETTLTEQDALPLWNVLQGEIVEKTPLGTKLMSLLLAAVPVGHASTECLQALMLCLTVQQPMTETMTLTRFCDGFYLNPAVIGRDRRLLVERMQQRVAEDPALQKEIEQAYSRWLRPECAWNCGV
ncbi:MAG: hypothetical protein A2Y38_09440 [Spirochaetes bacterium GWB1_59_5]|nr:MAG: hypothetical protein A2Y38_09440 [Spirochaetes bacterium GWB1_59_5]